MTDADYVALLEQMDELKAKIHRLEKTNQNMVKSIRHYKRVVKNYKQKLEETRERRDKQHYHNGQKRGSHGKHG